MILNAIIDDQVCELNVPDALLGQAEGFFDKLDSDMDGGWQMGREWVECPDRVQRCQIVADKLLTAMESENERLGVMMAGYLLARMPGLKSVQLDIQGEVQNNSFEIEERPVESTAVAVEMAPGLSKLEAMEQAGNAVSKVFKVGRGYRFSVFDAVSGDWCDSPLIATEEEAGRLRQAAFRERYESLLKGEA
ncbi:hypothetical protein ThidrDRAFT_3349 [Thiorhodococcus drewsii AZ1]|uniref:Uncharacterized protein n=1 Tax=Thiorhodococcus drewsii AZ1 TaxID=765913 RepID=G2E4Y6_9GAMM|nr:hypothetical protein [Thiorhodococcus drewsii]EGV29157.1 hypothetical protein ThidrDRAFT_3349 [Thiorhodococcus drewsii AZ1]